MITATSEEILNHAFGKDRFQAYEKELKRRKDADYRLGYIICFGVAPGEPIPPNLLHTYYSQLNAASQRSLFFPHHAQPDFCPEGCL